MGFERRSEAIEDIFSYLIIIRKVMRFMKF